MFKQAELAMMKLKKEKRFCYWDLGDRSLSQALQSLVEMSNAIFEDMTEYQRKVFHLVERGMEQKSIVEELGKHQQSVSDAVKRGKATLVSDAYWAIDRLLERITMLLHCIAENNEK